MTMTEHHTLATWEGFCTSCDVERPLILVEHGPRGLGAWLAGTDHEDRTLSYNCRVCGRVEYVPLTEAEDADYDETLTRWPDWVPVSEDSSYDRDTLELGSYELDVVGHRSYDPLAVDPALAVSYATLVPAPAVPGDVFALAAQQLLGSPPAPAVPSQPVQAEVAAEAPIAAALLVETLQAQAAAAQLPSPVTTTGVKVSMVLLPVQRVGATDVPQFRAVA